MIVDQFGLKGALMPNAIVGSVSYRQPEYMVQCDWEGGS
jgi:hypothetical protein